MIKRLLLLTVATGLALIGLVSVAPSATAAGCTASAGTTIAVDFSPWGRGVRTGCVIGAPDGSTLLSSAGFNVERVAKDPTFICRVSGYPTQSQQSCVVTPPAGAYWSYWIAAPGSNSWQYSQEGAGADTPVKGGVEGWAWGAGKPPSASPDQVRAQYPAAAPSPTEGSTSGSTAGIPKPTRLPTSAVPVASATPSSSASAPVLPPSSASAPSASPSSETLAPTIAKGAPPAASHKSGSGPLGIVIALGVIAVLGVGGLFARRRFVG